MNYTKSLLVLCLVGCCLAAPKPIDWDNFGRKIKDFGHQVRDKYHEVKDKILPAAKSTCDLVNSIPSDDPQDKFSGYFPQQQRKSFSDFPSFANHHHNTHFEGFPKFHGAFHKPHFPRGFDQHSNFPKFHPFHKFVPNHHFPHHPFPSYPSYPPAPPTAEHPARDFNNNMAPPPNPPMNGFDLSRPGPTTTKTFFNEGFTVAPLPSSSEAGDAVAFPTSPIFTSSSTSESTVNFDLPVDSDEQGGSNNDLLPDNSGEQGDSQDPDFPFLSNNDNTGGFDNAVTENSIEKGGADNNNVVPPLLDDGGKVTDETIEQKDMNSDDDIPPFIAPKDENGIENDDGNIPDDFFNNFEDVKQRQIF